MIEDSLREIIAAGFTTAPVYARLLPLPMPECVCVQVTGGRTVSAGIRRTRHAVTLMACSSDRGTAASLLREARNVLITSVPSDNDGVHFYTATALADGALKRKTPNGPRYVEYCDFEVVASL